MSKVSVIIPARNEPYINQTIRDIFSKSVGEIEVWAVLEGFWPEGWPALVDLYKGRLHTIHHGQPHGMRASINEAVAASSGEYLLKTDAHCMFAEGFDETLKEHCDERTIVIPRRLRLDAENWKISEPDRTPVDYEYLAYPKLKGQRWDARTVERQHIPVDETWLTQGSCWLMRKSYFEHLDLMDEENYGTFWKEMLEISCKAWLSGGRLLTDKRTWYAHLHKTKRGYAMESEEERKAHAFCEKWLTDSTGWKKQTRPFSWLVGHFNPPTWENWGTHGNQIYVEQQGQAAVLCPNP